MKTIKFITGNAGKLEEAKAILPSVEGIDIDLPEIQEMDAQKVIEAKLEEAHKRQAGEYIVEDTSVHIDALGGLPGPLIKWFLKALGDEGIAKLVKDREDTNAEAVTMIGHITEDGEMSFFAGRVEGKIVAPRGEGGFGWDKIFQPNGSQKTYGEMSRAEKNTMSMRKLALKKLAEHLGVEE